MPASFTVTSALAVSGPSAAITLTRPGDAVVSSPASTRAKRSLVPPALRRDVALGAVLEAADRRELHGGGLAGGERDRGGARRDAQPIRRPAPRDFEHERREEDPDPRSSTSHRAGRREARALSNVGARRRPPADAIGGHEQADAASLGEYLAYPAAGR
ncbi:hypothetical protein [Sorangium sp. So ce117]|uniref:hypothetical protein n=1 Tax=Sorangium sp. So ce117 TaxID=3133277 RepID=UPI003F639072